MRGIWSFVLLYSITFINVSVRLNNIATDLKLFDMYEKSYVLLKKKLMKLLGNSGVNMTIFYYLTVIFQVV